MTRRYSENPLVDLALDDGRISIDDRERVERAYEVDPHETAKTLAALPRNEEIARLNALGISYEEAYLAEAPARLMLPEGGRVL